MIAITDGTERDKRHAHFPQVTTISAEMINEWTPKALTAMPVDFR
ncbi:hypothetical protein ACFXOY_25030 [Streptomyces niveus]